MNALKNPAATIRREHSRSFPYSLPMSRKVRKGVEEASPRDRTKVSSKHQVTIPAAAFHGAGLEPGDTLRVEAQGAGRVLLTRVGEMLDRYSGCLDTGGGLRSQLDELRDEWR
ncbi:MAG TPA: AbrB/MazE/SpoVT family DNA-binding domain-containing protein [Solirubrobacterales bacterium]|nr:AbrB/MazE/SpoVT family DNA-binding domain-containing protein [Solirubrobacterales bacterium]